MEKINRQRAPKGTVTIRKKGNSFEARITLDLNAVMEGVDKNPRLSRTAKTEKEARQKLGELITDVYFDIKNKSKNEKVFSDECTQELDKFKEYKEEKSKRRVTELAEDYTLFPNLAKEWLNWKKQQINPSTNKTIGPKTVEAYVNTIKSNIMVDFKNVHVNQFTKEFVEEYINRKRKNTPRLAKDLFLLIRNILEYCKEKRQLIEEVPKFDIKFPKKKRATKRKISYLTETRQQVWLDILEKDKREFALLFTLLMQTGLRPEEGCGLKWKYVFFDKNVIKVEDACKDITLYDDDMNVIGHKCEDGELKTDESYRTIPMLLRLRKMLINLKKEKMEKYQMEGKTWNDSNYVFLNTIGGPYVPERLTSKMTSIIKKYKLEHLTVYGLRHSFATLNSEKGMDKEVLRELMGHAEFETTDFYYVHISEERKKKECERIYGSYQDEENKKTVEKQPKRFYLKKNNNKKKKRVLKLSFSVA